MKQWIIDLWTFFSEFTMSVFSRPDEVKQSPMNMPTIDPHKIATVDPDTMLPWENKISSVNNRHNVRVMCDLAGLKLFDKNVITACVEQESDFYPLAIGKPNSNGTKDWGICQFNDGKYHDLNLWIGPGAHFPNTQYVLDNPEECVRVMIAQYKAGNIHFWSSYSTGAYKKYMPAY